MQLIKRRLGIEVYRVGLNEPNILLKDNFLVQWFQHGGVTLDKSEVKPRISTTTPRDLYQPNHFSGKSLVNSFNSWLTLPLGVVVQTHWLNLPNKLKHFLSVSGHENITKNCRVLKATLHTCFMPSLIQIFFEKYLYKF